MTSNPKSLPHLTIRETLEISLYRFAEILAVDYCSDDMRDRLQTHNIPLLKLAIARMDARPTQPMAGLVEKLQRHHDSIPHDDRNADALGKRAGVSEAINIIRTHQPVISEERRKELTEQVALAISAWRWDRKSDEPWDSINEPVKKAYRDQAKAALSVVLKELGGEG